MSIVPSPIGVEEIGEIFSDGAAQGLFASHYP
jgi:hypothetical protein